MALITDFVCTHCRKPRREVVVSNSRVCAECRGTIATIEENAFLDKRDLLPLQTRVRLIERDLYRLNLDRRLKALESHHIKY